MPSDRAAAATRDAGLRRVSRLTRWLLAGALALTAGCSAIAARSIGTTSHQSASQTAVTNGSSQSSGSDAGSSDSGSTLQAPSSLPSASGGSGSVTSGGS
jgi:hypothetical protein